MVMFLNLVNICDFYREQAWDRWLSRKSNNCSKSKETIRSKLRMIARAHSETHYYEVLVALKDSSEWKTPQQRGLRRCFEGKWQKQHKVYWRTANFTLVLSQQSNLVNHPSMPLICSLWKGSQGIKKYNWISAFLFSDGSLRSGKIISLCLLIRTMGSKGRIRRSSTSTWCLNEALPCLACWESLLRNFFRINITSECT